MTQRISLSRAALVALCLAAVGVTGCTRGSKEGKADQKYVAQDVETIYVAAKDFLDRRRYKEAALLFDEVERQHPYSIWARRAQLMSAFSYYRGGQYQEAILSAQRFLSLHPGNKDAAYAYYLVAVSYYEQIISVDRDQKTTQQALDALNELVRRYPDTDYAADARLKLDLARDHLAGKEMEVGRFYQVNGNWLAATVRFKKVIDSYDGTSHVPEALERLVESYLALGIPAEAKKAAAVLGFNYPGSVWYERAYKLVQKHKA